MTTITVDNGDALLRKKFSNVKDLYNYLSLILSEQKLQLSESENAELDKRYQDLKNDSSIGISMKDIEAKYKSKLSS